MKPKNATDYCSCFNVTTKQQYKTINTAYSYTIVVHAKSGPCLRDLNSRDRDLNTKTFSLETEMSKSRPNPCCDEYGTEYWVLQGEIGKHTSKSFKESRPLTVSQVAATNGKFQEFTAPRWVGEYLHNTSCQCSRVTVLCHVPRLLTTQFNFVAFSSFFFLFLVTKQTPHRTLLVTSLSFVSSVHQLSSLSFHSFPRSLPLCSSVGPNPQSFQPLPSPDDFEPATRRQFTTPHW